MELKTYDQIVTETIESLKARTHLSNFNPGSIIRTITEVYANVSAELFEMIGRVLKQAYLQTATDYFLDLKAQEFGIERKGSTKTEGKVTFLTKSSQPAKANIPIPNGSIVATGVDGSGMEYRFITTQKMVLLKGNRSITVPVIAETAGADHNVGPNSICRLKTFINGIAEVVNRPEWLTQEGTDRESDDVLRERTFLAWDELARGSTKQSYISWTMGINGVKKVWVNDNLPRGQGTLDIYVLGESGMPSQALIAKVQKVVDKNKPLCADVLVKAPSPVNVAVKAFVTLKRGTNSQVVETEIIRRLNIYFSGAGEDDPELLWLKSLGVGQDVIKMQVAEIIMSVDGVHNLDLLSPRHDIKLNSYEYAVLGNINLTFGAATNV